MESNEALNTEALDAAIHPNAAEHSLSFGQGFWYGIQFLLIQLTTMIPVGVIGMLVYGLEDQAGFNNFIMFVGLPIAFIVGAWYFIKKRGLIENAFQWRSEFIKLTLIGLFLMYGVNYIIGEITTYLPGYDSMLEMYNAMFEGINPIALIIGGAIIGPICEEIIFRGVILEGLSKKYDPTKAIIFSALIFGIIHLQPLQVIGAFFAGLILGWIYLRTKSLWVVSALHVIHNAAAFLLADPGTASTREYFGNDLFYVGSFALSAIAAFLAYKGFEKATASKESVEGYANV